ncbi:hypothetical protein ACIRS1_38015 [Kitasatospora sp. NPDC101176]|uniref:hypothetical protein n=1 Tax=Kitasatospora sp. NPDC101176 TaxID=3364099 RepID=UPI0038304B1E
MAVREAADGLPFAEVLVEVGPALHGELVEAAVDSGFVIAAGEPPDTTGLVEVGGGRVVRLVLVGGRSVWEPDARVEVSPGWLTAARGRGAALVVLVPPGTWPPGLIELEPEQRLAVFTEQLDRERAAGRVLHGMAPVRPAS